MTATEEIRIRGEVVAQELREHVLRFGIDATALVVGGYSGIRSAFESAQKRGLIPRGRLLSEMIHSSRWDVPALLTHKQMLDFQEMTGLVEPTELLTGLWYILENVCSERSLGPVLAINRTTGEVSVGLAK